MTKDWKEEFQNKFWPIITRGKSSVTRRFTGEFDQMCEFIEGLVGRTQLEERGLLNDEISVMNLYTKEQVLELIGEDKILSGKTEDISLGTKSEGYNKAKQEIRDRLEDNGCGI